MIFTRQFWRQYMIKRALITFLLIIPMNSQALSDYYDRLERDSGRYVSQVKVRDFYVTPEGELDSSSDKVYSRSTITFKYDGSLYTVEFAKKKLEGKVASRRTSWEPSHRWVN